MNKIITSIFLSTTILFSTACSKANNGINEALNQNIQSLEKSSTEKNSSVAITNIEIDSSDSSQEVELEYNIDSTVEEKVNLILNLISENCFSGLPMKAAIKDYKVVEIELKDEESNQVSWEKTYLNNHTKEETINIIVKNILQENLKFETNNIKEVRLYYDDKLITLD